MKAHPIATVCSISALMLVACERAPEPPGALIASQAASGVAYVQLRRGGAMGVGISPTGSSTGASGIHP